MFCCQIPIQASAGIYHGGPALDVVMPHGEYFPSESQFCIRTRRRHHFLTHVFLFWWQALINDNIMLTSKLHHLSVLDSRIYGRKFCTSNSNPCELRQQVLRPPHIKIATSKAVVETNGPRVSSVMSSHTSFTFEISQETCHFGDF